MKRLSLLLALFASVVGAQQPIARPIATDDYVGYWKLLPLSDNNQPKILPANPWPGTCQFFVHAPSKVWLQITSRDVNGVDLVAERCQRTANDLEGTLLVAPKTASWEVKNGFVIVEIPDRKIAELWKTDIFTADIPLPNRFGVEVRKGDVAMQLVDMKQRQILWVRLLRRVE